MGIKSILEKLTIKQLYFCKKVLPKRHHEVLDYVYLEKYLKETDFEQLDTTDWPICSIEKGEFPFPLFQVFFLNSMIKHSIYCLAHKKLPYINFRNTDNVNLWEQFLEQPFVSTLQGKYEVCDVETVKLNWPVRLSDEEVTLFHKLYKKMVVFNEFTTRYFEDEYKNVLKEGNQRTIGVLCRGTDYTANKPKGHPIQPAVEDVINDVVDKMKVFQCEYIYLATEEEKVVKMFEDKFPGKILVNNRQYYDDFYDLKEKYGEDTRISWVHHERVNDNYYKSLEYLSSIHLLSKCNCLIGGCCGGTQFARILNNNQFEYVNLFDLGEY